MSDIVDRLRDRRDAAGWLGDGMRIRLEAADEIESLRIQLKQAEERAEYAWKNTNTIEKERQRLETLEKDAERYRWLVDHTYVEDGCLELSVNIYCHASQNRADRDIAVDRAMEESVK